MFTVMSYCIFTQLLNLDIKQYLNCCLVYSTCLRMQQYSKLNQAHPEQLKPLSHQRHVPYSLKFFSRFIQISNDNKLFEPLRRKKKRKQKKKFHFVTSEPTYPTFPFQRRPRTSVPPRIYHRGLPLNLLSSPPRDWLVSWLHHLARRL